MFVALQEAAMLRWELLAEMVTEEIVRQRFRKALADVRRLLEQVTLSATIEEVSNLVDSIRKLEAEIERVSIIKVSTVSESVSASFTISIFL